MAPFEGVPALRLESVTVTVPDGRSTRTILDAVDLSVAPGEVVAVTGPSGSGKSTLLAIAGLLRAPDSGEVWLGSAIGTGGSNRHRTALRRDHIALVFQQAMLIPSLTAIEQLELVAHVRGESRRSSRERATQLLEEVGLSELADQLPAQLSGGERQRVGIARALMGRPTVLLADEPTASLDPSRAANVADLLADRARDHGVATVVVTHDADPIRVADRHLVLDGGALQDAASVAG